MKCPKCGSDEAAETTSGGDDHLKYTCPDCGARFEGSAIVVVYPPAGGDDPDERVSAEAGDGKTELRQHYIAGEPLQRGEAVYIDKKTGRMHKVKPKEHYVIRWSSPPMSPEDQDALIERLEAARRRPLMGKFIDEDDDEPVDES